VGSAIVGVLVILGAVFGHIIRNRRISMGVAPESSVAEQ
jgi:hypothetical protein